MKTYEGQIIIKWGKNDKDDCRPLTIDCENEDEMQSVLKNIKNKFMKKGCDLHPEKGLPYSVKFNINERK